LNLLKSLTNHIVKTIIFIVLLSTIIYSQQDTDSVGQPIGDSIFVMQKSPLGAVLRSAVIPGWGQIYNESYWKAPVIWGITGALVYSWIQYNKDFNFYREQYISSGIEQYRYLRTFYQDQRDLMTIYIGLTYLLNLVDAYVDAQLFDFTVNENSSTKSPMLGIRVNF
jgi:Family of unknown function (DUF5683)